jgi:hypothetical protein
MLPDALFQPLREHLARRRRLYEEDLAVFAGCTGAQIPQRR